MEILLSILFTTALVIGFSLATTSEGLLEFIVDYFNEIDNRRIFDGKSRLKVFKPLATCPSCMPSIWSLFGIGFLFVYKGQADWSIFKMYPIIVAGSSLLSCIIWLTILKLANNETDSKNTYAENGENDYSGED